MSRDDARARAREIFVGGATLAEAASAVGVPLSTVQKWSSAEQWGEHRDAARSYGDSVKLLKRSALTAAIRAADEGLPTAPQLIGAWRSIETAFPEYRYAGGVDAAQARAVVSGFVEQLVELLAARDPSALRALQPHIAPAMEAWEARSAA
jgi:hypothetical protein